ncbi:hypothetical protein F5Y07DRAFT_403873 [Xylaria sp. FL0933]|nr:hypothetical protein F5Y07DRAFT_403873 [Xylaria sp. FL0933]
MAQSSTRSEALTALSTQAGTERGKTRSACDRCHRQKLKCIKAVDRTACERCERLTIECRYSPRERRTVRSKQRSRTPPPSDLRNLAPAIIAPPAAPGMRRQSATAAVPASLECGDWLAMQTAAGHNAEGLDDLNPGLTPMLMAQAGRFAATDTNLPAQLNAPPSLYSLLDCGDGAASHALSDYHHNVTSEVGADYLPDLCHLQGNDDHLSGPSCGPGYTLTSTTQQLASLNLALYECASKLPSIKASRAGGLDVPRAMNSSTTRGAALLALDEVFHVTTAFINILNNVDPMFTHTHDEITPALEEISSSSSFLPLDEASVLLFLSCHCRLTDIYEAIFQAIQRCIKGGSHTAAPHSTVAGIILPQLQVGGFGGVNSPALRVDFKGPRLPSAIVSMYMVLITTLSSRLWAQIRDRMRRTGGRDCSRRRVAMVHPEIAEPTWGLAMERTDNLSRIIEGIRDLL